MIRRVSFWVVAAFLTGSFAVSNPQDEGYTRLARLSYLTGHVSFQHSSDVDWSAASINLPLEPGDRIYTGNDGRAEVEFDDGSTFRLAENTDVEILSLRDELIQLRIILGLSTLNVLGNADFEINTPAAAFNAVREGIYRFDVVENGDTDAIVRKGELEAANNEFSQRLQAGDLMHLSPGDRGRPEISRYETRDPWDEWNDRRNADLQVYGNQRYLPDNVYMGSSELYRYGRWVNVEPYGTGWVPSGIDPYWSPYSVGRWCYRPFYGWTWVSYEPWGWLPYHYGSWYNSSIYGWCWLPGPAYSFNFWSPGLVTFYNGPGWVSWCPLGPGDYYDVRNYHYRHGVYSHQLAEIRGLHTRRPGDPFNRDVRGAFRTVQLEQFRNGSFDGRNQNTRWGNVERPWSQGTLVRERLDIRPTSKSFSAVSDRAAVRPRAANTLPAVVRNVPARDSRAQQSFTQITNPQIRSAWSGSARGRVDSGTDTRDFRTNGRVIQVPQDPPASSPAVPGGSRSNSSRWSNSRTNDVESSHGGAAPATPNPTPARQSPSQPNPGRGHIERSTPERQQNTRPATQPNPRSEFRQDNNYSITPPSAGRWSDSGSGTAFTPLIEPRNGGAAYAAPRSGNGRWADPSPGVVRAPSPRPDNPSRSGGNSNPGLGRAQDSGRMPSYSAPRQSPPSFERGGGRPSAPPSQSHESGSAGRSAPQGNSGHRR